MPIVVSKCRVPESCYPRYEYSASNVVSMIKRHRALLRSLKLETSIALPDYGDPEVYVVTSNKSKGFVEKQNLIQREDDDGAPVREESTVQVKDIDTLIEQEQVTHVTAKVVVVELSTVPDNIEQWGRHCTNVLLVTSNKDVHDKTSKLLGENNDVELSTVTTLGKDICSLLERIVFRKLNELIPELKCLSFVAESETIARSFEEDMLKQVTQILKVASYFEGWLNELEAEYAFNTNSEVVKTDKQQTQGSDSGSLVQDPQESQVTVPERLKSVPKIEEYYVKGKEQSVELTFRFVRHILMLTRQHIGQAYSKLPTLFRDMLPADVQRASHPSDKLLENIQGVLFAPLMKRVSECRGDTADSIRNAMLPGKKELVQELVELLERERVFEVDEYLNRIRMEEEASTRRLLWEIIAMYKRSRVPEAERPRSPVFQGKRLNDKVSKHVFDNVKGAKSIGYRCDRLHVFVESADEEEQQKMDNDIKRALAKFHITDFKIIPTKKILEHYRQVGAKIKVWRRGTLGGFAYMGDNNRLCALLSKHVVNGEEDVYLVNGNMEETKIGSMVQTQYPGNQPAQPQNPVGTVYVDVAAAKILDNLECDVRFRDSKGRIRPSRLYEGGDPSFLNGRRVYIRGASTKFGQGTITVSNCSVQGDMASYIMIEDIQEGEEIKRFSMKGDSGAVVCADDPDGEFVEVISMLIGISNSTEVERNPSTIGQYWTFRMDHGLQALTREFRERFTLVE